MCVACVRTDLSAGALVVERAEGDGRQQDGNVQEDGRRHVLQQSLVASHHTCTQVTHGLLNQAQTGETRVKPG